MRNFQLLFVAILVMAQLPLASAQELRKPHDNEIIISREYRDGRTGVTFYLNNQTDRLFCIYAAGKASGVHQNRNDSPILLLPHEQGKLAVIFLVPARAVSDPRPVESWYADILLAVSSVPGMSERPSMQEALGWSREDQERLRQLCGKIPLTYEHRSGQKVRALAFESWQRGMWEKE